MRWVLLLVSALCLFGCGPAQVGNPPASARSRVYSTPEEKAAWEAAGTASKMKHEKEMARLRDREDIENARPFNVTYYRKKFRTFHSLLERGEISKKEHADLIFETLEEAKSKCESYEDRIGYTILLYREHLVSKDDFIHMVMELTPE